MVKRKTVHKVYKKSSRKTKRRRKNSRTFKKKKRTQKRKYAGGGLNKGKMTDWGRDVREHIDRGLHRAGDLRRHDTVSINPGAYEKSDSEIIFLAGEEMRGPVNRYCVNDIDDDDRATLMQWQFDGLTGEGQRKDAARRVPALEPRGIDIKKLTKIEGITNADKIYMEACKNSTSKNKYYTIALAEEYNRGWMNGQRFAGKIFQGNIDSKVNFKPI
jgi:hypothetical protein